MKVTDEMVTAALCAKYGEGDVSDMLRGCGDEETSIMRAALTAAIALMRGQSEVVTIDLGESGLLHNARVTGPVRVVAKSGEQVAGNIFQPYGGWEPLVISKDPADEQ